MDSRRIAGIIIVVVLLLAILAGINYWLVARHNHSVLPTNAPGVTLPGKGPITIILAPDFGDAVLSLGGLLAQHNQPAIVATFFTAAPSPATTTATDQAAGFTDSTVANSVRTAENQRALSALGAVPENYGYVSSEYGWLTDDGMRESNLSQDIQALLVANIGRPVFIYGPADFGPMLTNPDTQALHDAFTDALSGFPGQNVQFFYYEVYPAVAAFGSSSAISLQKSMENESGLFFNEVDIALTTSQVAAKIGALKQYQSITQMFSTEGQDIAAMDQAYTSTRCAGTACEAVYQVIMPSILDTN